MAVRLTCINKIRNNSNNIQAYQLRDLSNGSLVELPTDELKKRIRNKSYIVNNLRLTSDGRLIDNESTKDSILVNYIESCELMGVKPLKIEKMQDKYIITDIPNNVNTLLIPNFVDAIAVKKRLNNSSSKDNYYDNYYKEFNKPGNIRMSNEEIERYLKEILRKTSNVEDKTLLIYNNQLNNDLNRSINDIKETLNTLGNKFDNIGSYIEANGQSIIDVTDKVRPLFQNALDYIIEDEHAFKTTDSVVTDDELCPFDGDLFCLGQGNLDSVDTYTKSVEPYTLNYVDYHSTVGIEKYVNYAYNTFISTYTALTREGGICRTISAKEQLGYLDALAGLSGCLMSLATVPLGGGAAALAGVVAGANNIPKDFTEAGRNVSSNMAVQSNKRKAEVLFKRNFSSAVNDLNDLNQYLDKFIYILALQYILSKNTSKINDLNRSGFCDRLILKTIKALDYDSSIDINNIELHILASYIAANIYIKYNYRFLNDFDESEITNQLSKASSKIPKQILLRQGFYYGLVEKYMCAALHCMFINPDVIYKSIVNEFRTQAKELDINLTYLDRDRLHRTKTIDIQSIINKDFIESSNI